MRKSYKIFATALILIFAAQAVAQARISEERKTFEKRVVVEKGESMLTLDAIAAGLNSSNSEFMLLLNKMDLSGAIYRVAPSYTFAYHDNLAFGIRFAYTNGNANIANLNFNLLSSDLSFDLKNVSLKYDGYAASVFHREYLGLDRKGTVGLYLEESLNYSYATSLLGTGDKSVSNRVHLNVAPGFILYIIPMVSVQCSVGILDLGYNWVNTYKAGLQQGSRQQWQASAKLNILNLNIGINFHF